MIVLSKKFNLDKSIIFNAIYDALEEMNFVIEEANRDLGLISISEKSSNSEKYEIILSLISLPEFEESKILLQGASENEESKEDIEKLFERIIIITARFNKGGRIEASKYCV